MNKAVIDYTERELSWANKGAMVFFYMGLITGTVVGLGLSILPAPYVAFVGISEFIISIILSVYVMVKQLKFIWDFDLDCNPKEGAKFLAGAKFVAIPAARAVGAITGAAIMGNWAVEEMTGVNTIRTVSRGIISGASRHEIANEMRRQYADANRWFDD